MSSKNKWRDPKAKPGWQPMAPAPLPDRGLLAALGEPVAVWTNDLYQVWVYEGKGGLTHLSIKRLDRQAVHDWRHFQRIKNEVCSPDREAVEIYPAEARLADSANQYHLWVFPLGTVLPFGFHDGRIVSSRGFAGAVQKPFEPDIDLEDDMAVRFGHMSGDDVERPDAIEALKEHALEQRKKYMDWLDNNSK